MDDLRFYVLSNSISVISGRCEVMRGKSVCIAKVSRKIHRWERLFKIRKISTYIGSRMRFRKVSKPALNLLSYRCFCSYSIFNQKHHKTTTIHFIVCQRICASNTDVLVLLISRLSSTNLAPYVYSIFISF